MLCLLACEGGTLELTRPSNPGSDTPNGQPPPSTDVPGRPGADTDASDAGADTGAGTAAPGAGGDLSGTGPYAVSSDPSLRYAAGGGCQMQITRHAPVGAEDDHIAILSHGFQRNRTNMRNYAQHLASWGVTVYTPTLCSRGFFGSDHTARAEDLVNFANARFNGAPVVYMGYSAGGLSSLLAAANDPNAIGVFGLDLVDSDNLGRDAASGVSVPVYGLLGGPALCNSQGNGAAVYDRAPTSLAYRLVDASHCVFESPSDPACGIGCFSLSNTFPDDAYRSAVSAFMTGFARWVTGIEANAIRVWTQGEPEHQAFRAQGMIVDL